MLRDSGVKPYADATISFEEVDFTEFQPTQLYVLQKALSRQAILHEEMSRLGVDTFHMSEGVRFMREDTPEEHTMIPPIVEYDESFGFCLLDGTHRSYTARQLGEKSLGAIVITGVSSELPIHSYPNSWEEMEIWQSIPEDVTKKRRYRLANDHASLFRDLSKINNSIARQPGTAA